MFSPTVKEDEKITASFWNGKKVKVPLGTALWISPAQWERIVEMIHTPISSRKKFDGQRHKASYYVCPWGRMPAYMHECTLGELPRHQWPHCSLLCPPHSHFYHPCSWFTRTRDVCCCPKACSLWHQPFLSDVPQGDLKEQEFNDKPRRQLLALEDAPKEESAAATMSTSSSCSVDSQSGEETCLTKSITVDQGVNTDSSLFDKPTVKVTRRPDWKYWKRSHPTSLYKTQGIQQFP